MDLFRSQYAIGSAPEGELGAYGAVLLKPWTPRAGGWRENELQVPGTVVPGEIVSEWPIANRVRFFLSPDEAAQAGPGIAAVARVHPQRAQVQAGDDLHRRRIEQLAKARQVKAELRGHPPLSAPGPRIVDPGTVRLVDGSITAAFPPIRIACDVSNPLLGFEESRVVIVVNGGAQTCRIYTNEASGVTIGATAGATGITLAAAGKIIFMGTTAGRWDTIISA